jgi:hypothetical protein
MVSRNSLLDSTKFSTKFSPLTLLPVSVSGIDELFFPASLLFGTEGSWPSKLDDDDNDDDDDDEDDEEEVDDDDDDDESCGNSLEIVNISTSSVYPFISNSKSREYV